MDFQKILNYAHEQAKRYSSIERTARPENPRDVDCGFAWVIVDGKDPFANWCRAEKKRRIKAAGTGDVTTTDTMRTIRSLDPEFGSKGYPRGWQWWCPGNFNGQSVRIHEAGAKGFRDALAEHGITATVGSRLD